MKLRSLYIALLLVCANSYAQKFIPSPVTVRQAASISATHLGGFNASIVWNGTGTFDLQRAFYSDYTDAITIYSGTSNSFIDIESVFSGYCFYRVRKNSGAWVTTSFNKVISDATIDTRPFIGGDSEVYGTGADVPANGFANYFYKVKGWTLTATGDIVGVPGNAITPESSPPYTLWPSSNTATKIVERNYCFNDFGVNDAASTPQLSNATPANYRVAQEAWVDYCVTTKAWPLNRIFIIGPFSSPTNNTRLVTFRDAGRVAAANKGIGFISVLDYQVNNSIVPPDNVHPNTAQHKQISYWLADHIENPGLSPRPPTITSISVESPTSILVRFNTIYMSATNTGWSFTKNGSANNPTAISGTGTDVLRFTVPAIASGDVVTYSYSQSTGDTYSEVKVYSLEIVNATTQPVVNNIPASYDTDSQALTTAITGTGETISTDERALYSNFISGLKTDGIWSKVRAWYVLGTSLNKSKFNWKDPQDLDASYRLAQLGTVTYSSDGVAGGSTANNFFDTNFNPSLNTGFRNSMSLVFSRQGTSLTGAGGCAIGSKTSSASGHYVILASLSDNLSIVFNNAPGFLNKNNPNPGGRYIVSRNSSASWTAYKNGLVYTTQTTASVASSNATITICGNYLPSNQKISCGGIFDGLTNSEAALLDSRIKTLEYGLNRI